MNLHLERPLPEGVGLVSQWFGEHPEKYATLGMAGHNGIDYAAPEGSLVEAAHAGTVVIGDDPAGFGVYVVILTPICKTIYAHLSHVDVRDGKLVNAKNPLGLVGSTGKSTGPHLHFGLKLFNGRNPAYRDWVDPLPFRRS